MLKAKYANMKAHDNNGASNVEGRLRLDFYVFSQRFPLIC
jgi:hypothetical protein